MPRIQTVSVRVVDLRRLNIMLVLNIILGVLNVVLK
jgi:hypothetical protein